MYAHEELIAKRIRLLLEELGIMMSVFNELPRDDWYAPVDDRVIQRKEFGQVIGKIIVVVDAEDGAIAHYASSVPKFEVETATELCTVV